MKTTLTYQVESLIEWATKRARLTRSRHYVRGVCRSDGTWYYESDAYSERIRAYPTGRVAT